RVGARRRRERDRRRSPLMVITDVYQRPLRNLRISVTDRCNLRCGYCMPEEDYVWLPREQILDFEEIHTLAELFKDLGCHHVRPERVTALTRRPNHAQVLEGIAALAPAGFTETKLDTVVMRGVNDDELADLIEYGRTVPAEVRFIEYMDVGGATRWSIDKVVSRAEMLKILERRYGRIEPVVEESTAPADRYTLADGTVFGIIASTTEPFCASCDRSRLTADGV